MYSSPDIFKPYLIDILDKHIPSKFKDLTFYPVSPQYGSKFTIMNESFVELNISTYPTHIIFIVITEC